jgi:filamentous hemagglutinin family protein
MPKPALVRADSTSDRRGLCARTALSGALCGLALMAPGAAMAIPDGGSAVVNAGGVLPTITLDTATNVKLNAPRTIINWNTFNVKPDESVTYDFGARNWIVMNRVVSFADSKIEGAIVGKVGADFGGNIWFVSASNIIFGKTATFDAGGLLVAVGIPDTAKFLDPSNTLFSFNGDDALPSAKAWVLGGAKINTYGGLAAFVAPSVVTRYNATITASGGGSVLYGSAKSFSIRLAPGAGGDFDLVDFIVPDLASGSEAAVAADLAGDTKANSIFVAAVSKSAIGSAVINLEGLTTAQAATSDGGDIILSGGGGITGRQAAPAVTGAANTDIYLKTAAASRDFAVKNVGRIIAHPWPRPLEDQVDPTTLQQDQDAIDNPPPPPPTDCELSNSCDVSGGNGFTFCPPDVLCAPVEPVDLSSKLLASLFNPSSTSTITVGRDARIAATADIQLGRIVSSRDVTVDGPSIAANSLIASGNLTVTSAQGDVLLAGVGVSGSGVITSQNDVMIDAISAPKSLTVTAGRDITLGDGTSNVAGVITLKAAQDVNLELNSAKLDTVTAGRTANLRGGALDIGTVTAPRLFAKANSIKIGMATSSGDIYAIATSGDASVGSATAGDDVYVIATHGTASLGSAALTGLGADGVSVDFDGNPDVAGNGRVVRVESTDLDASLGQGKGFVSGATGVTIKGGQDAIVDVTKDLPGVFQIVAARDATLKAPTVKLDAITAGRDLTFATTSGDLTLTNNLTATRNISISAGGALKVADVRADSGSVLLSGSTVSAGNVSASDDLTLKATAGGVSTTSFKVGRDLIVQGSSLALGSSITSVTRDLSITSLGNFTASNDLAAGRNLTLAVAGNGTFKTLTAAGTLTVDVAGKAVLGQTSAANARIVAGDLDLTGVLTAPAAQIEARNGAIRVGGAAGDTAGQLTLDSNDFGQLRVSGALTIYAGSTTSGARGDLTLQSLTINPASTPNVVFDVGSGNTAFVPGLVAPTAGGGGVLRIGDASNASWRPTSIQITGGLGAATYSNGAYSNINAFDEVRLAATQDILMGSQRFIALIQGAAIADIDTAAGKPAGVAPTAGEINKVFISTGKLEVSAANKVVQQNTSATFGVQPVGVFFTGKSQTALIIDPPKVMQLWGAFAGANGQVVTGQAAGNGLSFTVVDASGQPTSAPSGAKYSFNSCDFSTSVCSAAAASSSSSSDEMVSQQSSGLLTTRDTLNNLGDAESGAAKVAATRLTSPPVLLSVAPVAADEIVADPVVTGAGSEEIWRQRRQKQ